MEQIHSLLRRQLKKYFGESTPPSKDWQGFIQAVNRAYYEFDDDRSMLERSLDLSSQELLQANAEMRAVFQAFPDLFFWLDYEGKILDCKGGKTTDLYLPREQFLGKRVQDIPLKNIGTKFQETIDELRKTKSVVNMEYSLVIEGIEYFYEARMLPLIEGQMILILRNITDRKRAEEAFAAEKERLAVTLRSIGDGVITTDINGRVLMINEVAETLTGWTPSEAFRKPLLDVFNVISETTHEPVQDPVQQFLEGGSSVELSDNMVLIARDGTERIISNSGAPIRDKQGKTIGAVLVFHDITYKRKMEKELQKIQKLESIGILAGGIAHDFNNILSGIAGSISLAKMWIDKGDRSYELLHKAEKAAFEARNLTQQLLTFSKGGAPIKESATIRELFEESASFALSGSNVRCVFDFPEDLWAVDIDRGQINQVINNLVINADQAMPEGGNIVITGRNILPGDTHKSIPLRDVPYVKVSVHDEGIGIPEKTLSKIFDPYFTTKQKGSGLGLAISFSIISRHDGFITAESDLGVGTTVHIYLPASTERVERKADNPRKSYGGRGRVLVVDDDRLIRDVFREGLSSLGYEVDCAIDGVDALELYGKAMSSGHSYDLVMMDLTIPGGMGGELAIKELLKLDPNAKAIVCSGYSNDPILAKYKDYGFSGALTKPFRIQDLSHKVAEAIGDTE
jgi:two-component system cell cycle sensor histidine kinase/response regulator CckA